MSRIQTQALRREAPAHKHGDAANQSERTDELLVSDIEGHVAERRGHRAHHSVIVDAEQLHEDGQAFLLPDGGSDVHGPLQRDRQRRGRQTRGRKRRPADVMAGFSGCCLHRS